MEVEQWKEMERAKAEELKVKTDSRKPETRPTITTTWTMRFFDRSFGFLVHLFVFSFVQFFSKNRSRRCDDFGPKIVKIGAILAILRPVKDLDAVR